MLESVFHPLALYGLGAVTLLLSLVLFVTVKAEVGALAASGRREREALEAQAAAARAEIEELREAVSHLAASLREMEEASGALVPPPPARSGLNFTVRSQVLRRHRLGEEPPAIATSMGLPLTEVNLLLKVNRLVLEKL